MVFNPIRHKETYTYNGGQVTMLATLTNIEMHSHRHVHGISLYSSSSNTEASLLYRYSRLGFVEDIQKSSLTPAPNTY